MITHKSTNNIDAFKIYLRLLKNIKRYKMAVFLVLFGLIAYAGAEAILYRFLVPRIIDEGFGQRNPEFLKFAPIFILVIFMSRGLANFLVTYFMGYIGRSTVRDYRCSMLETMMRLPVSFFQSRSSGELISKVNYDAEQVAASISNALTDALRGVLLLVAMLWVMFSINWKITSLALLIGPIIAIYLKSVSKRMRVYSTKVQNSMGDVTQVANEVVDGYQVIKSFDGIDYETKRIKRVTENNRKREMKMYFATAVSIPVTQCLGSITLSVLIYFSTLETIKLSAGEFAGMFGALLMMLRPMKQIAAVNSVLQKGIAAAESIFKLLDEEPEKDFGTKKLDNVAGEIKFENVYFSYEKALEDLIKPDCDNDNIAKLPLNNNDASIMKEYVLRDINFHVKPGENVALVGPSGSGKSTIAALLPRFFNVTKGTICIDGIDINNYCLRDLRRQIAVVTQEVILFNDTIANNIAYGSKTKSTKTEIYQAAKAAFVTEFTDKLPDGINTEIGENGVKLSGGQRQRIAIARAILKNAPILILDEATSALDTESERYIQKALDRVVKNRTTLIIAHRLSTIESVDKILVIDAGRIIEFGSHKELISKDSSRYARLRAAQFK